MGLYDRVKIDIKHDAVGVVPGAMFQTKSLHAGCHEFSINSEGKLVEHLYRFEPNSEEIHPYTGQRLSKAIHVGDRMIEFHGDILLRWADPLDDERKDFIARFTDGTLERMIPLTEYPDDNLDLVLSQGAR